LPRLAAAALLLALFACAEDEPAPVPVHDLGDKLPLAQVSVESDGMTLGSPEDESHLLTGWSHREHEPRSGRSFRWGLEPYSEIAFTVLEPRPVTLRLEARPRRGPAAVTPALEVVVNGHPAGRLELAAERREYRLELPAELLVRGANRLRFTYEMGAPPPPEEERRIGVAWYRIDFNGLDRPSAQPRFDTERRQLFLPYGSRVDYYLRPGSEATLSVPRYRFVGGAGRLGVLLATDEEEDRRLGPPEQEGAIELVLPSAPTEPVRLALTAVAAGAADEGGGIVLEAPAIWGRPPDPPQQAAAPPLSRASDRPNVIVYLVDTLRADHLGCYGYPRPVSPRIDEFAAGATLFENARAQAPWTLPSVASVMTGLWPPAHGVVEDSRRLAPEAVTLAEVLAGAGYQTAAVVTNGFASGAYGLDQGFDQLTLIKTEGRKSHQVHQTAVEWLDSRDPERPFFLYLHTLDPHKPYLPSEEHRQRFAADADEIWRQIVANPMKQVWEGTDSQVAQLYALYDAEIAENDASFGDTLDALESAGLYDEALVVFLSDHGEEFNEHHSWTHASNLFREVLNVPLIVKLPGQREGRRVAELAQQIDLMPSLLTYLGIDGPATQGRLLPALLGPSTGGERRIFSHTHRKSQTTASVIEGDWKFIRRVDDKGTKDRLYNWREDPAESRNRVTELPVLAGLLATAIQERLTDSRPPGTAEATPDEAVLENLRALGYVD
jgi:arylsulfatase A-like enzyme